MPRNPRIHAPDALWHVISRGNRHQDVFEAPAQYEDFLGNLGIEAQKGWVTMNGHILMPNHWHGLAREGPVPLSRVMLRVLTKCATRSNKFNGRTGHVFQGRFKSYLVDSDEKAREVLRYIHYNAVRAGLEERPGDWKWSSHDEYAGKVPERLTSTGLILSTFSPATEAARAAYLKFMSEPPPKGVRPDLIPLFNRLAERIETESGMGPGGLRMGGLGREGQKARGRFIRLAAESGAPARFIAAYLNISTSAVFWAIRS